MALDTTPTKTDISTAESSLLDIMATAYPSIATASGSAVRELIVKTAAYIHACMSKTITDTADARSVLNLQESQKTSNSDADTVASTYFITRREGTRSKGSLSLVLSIPALNITAGSVFSVEGTSVTVEKTVIGMEAPMQDTDTVDYVRIYTYGQSYIATVPVVAVDTGSVEIEAGVTAVPRFSNSTILSCTLVSALTGGTDTETDASMMARAKASVAGGNIGSYYGIRKKLDEAPVTVIDFSLITGEAAVLTRARYNTSAINPGGFVDCFVKLQKQASVITCAPITKTYETATSSHTLVLTDIWDSAYGAFYGIDQLTVNNVPVSSYSVSYASADSSIPAANARLSVHQIATVSFQTSAAVSSITANVAVRCMPGIRALHDYMTDTQDMFIGNDMLIRAAVPVELRMDCCLRTEDTTDATLSAVKNAICEYVNALPVGKGALNMSELRRAVTATIPTVDLILPCVLSADTILTDGSMTSFYSTSGILDITNPAGSGFWDPSVCFFSLIPSRIRLEYV